MNDPHVVSLEYRVWIDDTRQSFAEGLTDEVELDGFACELVRDSMTVRPHGHYATAEEARADLDPQLRAWEAYAELTRPQPLRFTFRNASIIDRAPAPGVLPVADIALVGLVEEATVRIENHEYPAAPPRGLREPPEVEGLRRRWRDACEGREPLLSAAYWVLSNLERLYSGRAGAAVRLQVSKSVLDTLGRLADRHDPQHGRKGKSAPQPLTDEEQSWVREVVPRLLLRVAEMESQLAIPQLTMTDFPDLP